MKAMSSPVIVSRISTRSDGSLGITLSTPELQASEKLAFLEAQNLQCRMILQPESESPESLVDVKKEFDTKTPGQRLRGCLFVAWRQAGEPGEFDQWYHKRMEGYISDVKQNLKPLLEGYISDVKQNLKPL
jgi:hypothetical protein